ncbi:MULTISPECIES: bifunctional protein-serine/threonine kinase/phosphatase [unclassified Acidovorax]|uniref:bifunctional protein-serine/threonine kinase/phosphatase n=1 Tax=unclassified Acidovorax TaxID=2684926 RepID=UPI001C464F33|nr:MULTISPECIES: bifunctional protein-serine/threonine kinase/phosphatase [unclassified Acidovorax]MBV7428937.1 bifunctional protein-serine/threonine kinase/phosphatase [Acidovorax sp. sif0732]MBV7450763.1 bifunctional protein-serine/threonine kinase/phosphatase [Acidovorax sp. sif0715]
MSFELDFGYTSQAGRKALNEDFAALVSGQGRERERGAIAAIADGVSTGGNGREAAQTTVNTLVNDYFATPDTWDTTVALDRILSAHNGWLASMNRRRQPAVGLTTVTALVLRGQSYTLAHVGDTRAYLLRGGRLQQLTADHVMSQHDFAHQLTRAMGLDDHVVVDYSQGELHSGDLFVLLSDGVHGSLPVRELRQLLRQGGPAQALSDGLVQAALRRGSSDNVTALIVQVQGVLEATLQDESRRAQDLPVLPLLKVGDTVDGLTVTALVADSGIHRIYQVRDGATQRLYALKTLLPARAHDAQERATLAHEAWVARRMQSGQAAAHLARLNDWPLGATGTGDGAGASAFYLLYDWHSGDTLGQRLRHRQHLAVGQAVTVAVQAARVLGWLHRQGVVHRDIKPDNLHLGDDGVLRVLDLGVALSGREPEATRRLHAGTPSYMNPEQWPGYERNGDPAGQLPDAGSDLFALGVTLYQLLSHGRLPYGEVVQYQLGRYHRDPVAPSRHNPGVPIWLDQIALKAVARHRAQRFETAEELLLALERGASRPLSAPGPQPLMQRDATALWKIALAVSVLVNLLLIYWLLFLPR